MLLKRTTTTTACFGCLEMGAGMKRTQWYLMLQPQKPVIILLFLGSFVSMVLKSGKLTREQTNIKGFLLRKASWSLHTILLSTKVN